MNENTLTLLKTPNPSGNGLRDRGHNILPVFVLVTRISHALNQTNELYAQSRRVLIDHSGTQKENWETNDAKNGERCEEKRNTCCMCLFHELVNQHRRGRWLAYFFAQPTAFLKKVFIFYDDFRVGVAQSFRLQASSSATSTFTYVTHAHKSNLLTPWLQT